MNRQCKGRRKKQATKTYHQDMNPDLKCQYCGKVLKSKSGKTRHIENTPNCWGKHMNALKVGGWQRAAASRNSFSFSSSVTKHPPKATLTAPRRDGPSSLNVRTNESVRKASEFLNNLKKSKVPGNGNPMPSGSIGNVVPPKRAGMEGGGLASYRKRKEAPSPANSWVEENRERLDATLTIGATGSARKPSAKAPLTKKVRRNADSDDDSTGTTRTLPRLTLEGLYGLNAAVAAEKANKKERQRKGGNTASNLANPVAKPSNQLEDEGFPLPEDDDSVATARSKTRAADPNHGRTQHDEQIFNVNDNSSGDDTSSNNNNNDNHNSDNMRDEVVDPLLRLDWNNDDEINVGVNTEMVQAFKDYCEYQKHHAHPMFTKAEKMAVRLADLLMKKKASLDTYDEVMLWHFRATGVLEDYETLGDLPSKKMYISRLSLMKLLQKRYNMTDKFAHKVPMVLPYSKDKVELVCHDAWGCIESLLTDPRVTDDDYCFFDNDPRAPPPERKPPYGDLITGDAYRAAALQYKQGDPNRVPLPLVLYIDGADTGHMKHMPITQLKVSLGIHSREYRDNEWAWRTLGYVAATSKAKGRAKQKARQSGHIAEHNRTIRDNLPGESPTLPSDDSGKAEDFHAMLDKILESFVDLQRRGFRWDLRYRGKTYKNLEFIPFVIFIKCDTKEADLLCGSYGSYNEGVQQLCRCCLCPNGDTDNPQARYRHKTVSMIKPLCDIATREHQNNNREKKDTLAKLKNISQHCINNATYKLRFSPYLQTRGIHGACPFEMLHATLLGVFMYVRNTIYDLVGPTSQYAEFLDTTTQSFGGYFKRQSERNMPKCNFSEGIREGKLNATEYRGVLLVLAATFFSSDGRKTMLKHRDFDVDEVDDWAELLELLLGWEAFLGKTEMTTRQVSKLSIKNRYIMWRIKKSANRTKAMGWRLVKYHSIVHMGHDILSNGVPKEWDTGSNESGHKKTKVAAMMTQKIGAEFDWQTSTRLDEFLLLELAMCDIEGQKLWMYFDKPADIPHQLPPHQRKSQPEEQQSTSSKMAMVTHDIRLAHHRQNGTPLRLCIGVTNLSISCTMSSEN